MKHTKSVADVDRSPQPPQLNSFAFPNMAAPLALETGDVDEVIVDMWWERDAIQCCREISPVAFLDMFKEWKKEQVSCCCTADVCLCQSVSQLYNKEKLVQTTFCNSLLTR